MLQPNQKEERAAPPARPGRPRDPARHRAILGATRQVILEEGYGALSFDGVARRAGVSRMTVYKWWDHRAELAEEAMFSDLTQGEIPDKGSFEEDLFVLVEEMVEQLTDPVLVRGMAPLRAELMSKPHLMKATGARYHEPVVRRWRSVFERAIARGELEEIAHARAAHLVVLGSIEALSQHRPAVLSKKRMTKYLVNLLLSGISTR